MGNNIIELGIQRARMSPDVRSILIPPCPALLIKMQNVLLGSDIDPIEIDKIASADVAMTAALIRQANSPFYGLSQPVKTVGMALTVLGVRPAVELLSAFITRNALDVKSPVLEHFWESSQRKAIACEYIGAQLYKLPKGLGYIFGLFGHIGIPVLLKAVRGYAGTFTEALARKDRTFIQTENVNHHTDHAVIGAIVSKTWYLPAEVVQAIWLHHDFSCLTDYRFADVVKNLVALGLLADFLVQDYDDLPPSQEWIMYGNTCLQYLSISGEELDHWVDDLYNSFQAVAY